MARRASALPALLAACALGCAAPPKVDLGDARLEGWLALRSPHFSLIGDVSRAELARLAEDLAVFVAVVQRLTTIPLHPARVPARIHLVRGPIAGVFAPDPGEEIQRTSPQA